MNTSFLSRCITGASHEDVCCLFLSQPPHLNVTAKAVGLHTNTKKKSHCSFLTHRLHTKRKFSGIYIYFFYSLRTAVM